MSLSAKIHEICERSAATTAATLDRVITPIANIDRSTERVPNGGSKKGITPGEYVWNIDNWLDKVNKARDGIDSDPFYSHENGYKMCLRVELVGGFYVYIQWCLMRGSFDDALQWPFEHDVTVDLIYQQTGISFESSTIKYADCPDDGFWKKPEGDVNDPVVMIRMSTEELLMMGGEDYRDLSIKFSVRIR